MALSLRTRIALFRMRLPLNIYKLKKKIKQKLCSHKYERYNHLTWGWGERKCSRCYKALEKIY